MSMTFIMKYVYLKKRKNLLQLVWKNNGTEVVSVPTN